MYLFQTGVKRMHSANSSTGVSSMASNSLPETPLSTDSSLQSLNTSVASSATASPQSPQSGTGTYHMFKEITDVLAEDTLLLQF